MLTDNNNTLKKKYMECKFSKSRKKEEGELH